MSGLGSSFHLLQQLLESLDWMETALMGDQNRLLGFGFHPFHKDISLPSDIAPNSETPHHFRHRLSIHAEIEQLAYLDYFESST